jgi:hypothetical protein
MAWMEPYSKIKAWLDNLKLLYGDEDMSFVAFLHEPNLFLFNFTLGDVKEAAGEGCCFFIRILQRYYSFE